MNTKENRKKLATAYFCRAYLNIHGFLSDAENEKVHKRIRKFQLKEKNNNNGITTDVFRMYI